MRRETHTHSVSHMIIRRNMCAQKCGTGRRRLESRNAKSHFLHVYSRRWFSIRLSSRGRIWNIPYFLAPWSEIFPPCADWNFFRDVPYFGAKSSGVDIALKINLWTLSSDVHSVNAAGRANIRYKKVRNLAPLTRIVDPLLEGLLQSADVQGFGGHSHQGHDLEELFLASLAQLLHIIAPWKKNHLNTLCALTFDLRQFIHTFRQPSCEER